jgi:hypothetical protein
MLAKMKARYEFKFNVQRNDSGKDEQGLKLSEDGVAFTGKENPAGVINVL